MDGDFLEYAHTIDGKAENYKTGESDQIFVCFIQVTSVSMATVLQQQPYQLFYELSRGNQTSDTYIVVPMWYFLVLQ